VAEGVIDYADIDNYRTIDQQGVQFSLGLGQSKLWNRPYTDMIDVSAKYLDYVIRSDCGRSFQKSFDS